MESFLVPFLCIMLTAAVNGLEECSGQDQYGCDGWAASGFCENDMYRQFMTSSCPAACGLCTAPPPPPPQNENVDVSACLGAHNNKRNLHQNTPNLSWDATLAAECAEYALQLATDNTFEHSSGSGYGENLYKSTGSSASNCEAGVNSWYDEINDYNFDSPGFSSATGHFTQVVWKATTHVGVGVATATHNGALVTVVVARYKPAGNVQGQFDTNVLQLK